MRVKKRGRYLKGQYGDTKKINKGKLAPEMKLQEDIIWGENLMSIGL